MTPGTLMHSGARLLEDRLVHGAGVHTIADCDLRRWALLRRVGHWRHDPEGFLSAFLVASM